MTDQQTLVLYSGHPLGLFPSSPGAPRAVVTNGLVIPSHSSWREYDRLFALGVTQYGQMTAGSYCYIGPQGIVHGTTVSTIQVRDAVPYWRYVAQNIGTVLYCKAVLHDEMSELY